MPDDAVPGDAVPDDAVPDVSPLGLPVDAPRSFDAGSSAALSLHAARPHAQKIIETRLNTTFERVIREFIEGN